MEFNTVLPRSHSSDVLAEVLQLASQVKVRATGVSQQGERHFQFQIELDASNQEWHMVTSYGSVWSFRDGVFTFPDGERAEGPFGKGMPDPMRMLHPDSLLIWGRAGESFYPVLAQEIGTHSILLTFEHVEDPAFRSTMVIDRPLGVIRKTVMLGDVTILTDVQPDQPMVRATNVAFEPITDWIRLDY